MIQLIESFHHSEDDDLKSGGPKYRRRFPLVIDEGISMIMEMEGKFLGCCGCTPTKDEVNLFKKKFKLFNRKELVEALKINSEEFYLILNNLIPCVGCRRSVETLYNEAGMLKTFAFYPLVKDDHTNIISLTERMLGEPEILYNLFFCNCSHAQTNLESITKSAGKARGRCFLHSSKDQKVSINLAWEIYKDMSPDCRKKIATIQKDKLHETVQKYIDKHIFCVECKARVHHAYEILVFEAEPDCCFDPELFENVRFCTKDHIPTEHIHVKPSLHNVSTLIEKALPDLINNQRDRRHAKTMEIAQEEVLICIGICIFERLLRIQQRFREEERSWEIIMCLCSLSLKKAFDLAVEKKIGMSQLELLCAELQEEENLKKQKNEIKKLKKKRRKEKKAEVEASQADEEELEACKENTPEVEPEIQFNEASNNNKKKRKNKNKKKNSNKDQKDNPVFVSNCVTECSNKVLVESASSNLPHASETSRNCGHSSVNQNNNVPCSSRDGSEIDSFLNNHNICTISSLQAESTKQFALVPLSKFSGSCSTAGLNIPYKTLEEQLKCLSLSNNADIPSIPEEEVLFFKSPAWEKERDRLREFLRTRFEDSVATSQKSTVHVQNNTHDNDNNNDNQNIGCDEESGKKQELESSSSNTSKQVKKQPRVGGKYRQFQGKSRYKGKNRV